MAYTEAGRSTINSYYDLVVQYETQTSGRVIIRLGVIKTAYTSTAPGTGLWAQVRINGVQGDGEFIGVTSSQLTSASVGTFVELYSTTVYYDYDVLVEAKLSDDTSTLASISVNIIPQEPEPEPTVQYNCYRYWGGSWLPATMYVYDGYDWVVGTVYVRTNTGWTKVTPWT